MYLNTMKKYIIGAQSDLRFYDDDFTGKAFDPESARAYRDLAIADIGRSAS